MIDIPKWLEKHLDRTHLQPIEAAIAAAETKTSGELVLMIVRSSSTTGHVPVVIFCLIYIGMLLFDITDLELKLGTALGMWPFINAVFAVILAFLLSRWTYVQRTLIPKEDRILQVAQRAELEFYRLGIRDTVGSTGILILISLLERRIEVKADKAIADKLPAHTWSDVVETILSGIKRDAFSEGLTTAVSKCGNLLSQHFPINTDDKNELSNHIIIKE